MAYQTETPAAWPAGVYQIAVTDPVLGGSDGAPNVMGAALAKRAMYQRMRSVTAWDATLAAAHDYPAKACVMHGATSWRAIVDNNVEPGSDPLKWERWGYSETELAAVLAGLLPYGAPVVCPNAGPDGEADKSKVHRSALGEYWMWLGDAWRVVAGLYGYTVTGVGVAIPTTEVFVTVQLATMPRAGFVGVSGSFRFVQVSSVAISLLAQINKNGTRVVSDGTPHSSNQLQHSAPSIARLSVAAGDVISFVAYKSGGSSTDVIEGASFSVVYTE